MRSDPFIDPAQWLRIEREIEAIERKHNVRVLFAVESGSRAWRYPSPDSDYDVRFIYAHPMAAYVSIETPADVIERPIDPVLDVSGWDIRKALQLLLRSNAVLAEWLTSPIRYRDSGSVSADLLRLVRETYYLPAVVYHYDRMARRAFTDVTASHEGALLKSYCYALRPALVLCWARRHHTTPPMAVPHLRAGLELGPAVEEAIDKLIASKAASNERGLTPRLPVLDAFIAHSLKEPVDRFVLPNRIDAIARANDLFALVVGQRAK